jgi:hypothetical protein
MGCCNRLAWLRHRRPLWRRSTDLRIVDSDPTIKELRLTASVLKLLEDPHHTAFRLQFSAMSASNLAAVIMQLHGPHVCYADR